MSIEGPRLGLFPDSCGSGNDIPWARVVVGTVVHVLGSFY